MTSSQGQPTGTIPELFDAAVARDPQKVWLFHDDEQYSYAEAAARIGTVAAGLAAHGVGRGSLVLATARNTSGYLFLWLAAARLGAIYVPLNPRSAPAELAGFEAQVKPDLIVADDELGAAFAGEWVHIDELAGAAPVDAPPAAARADDPAVLIPTSGTTGRSKLVTQTQRAYVLAGEGFPFWLQLSPSDRLMTSLPLFHINAPAYSTLGSVAIGASLVLLPRFSPKEFLDQARHYEATEFNAIGAMLEMLMNTPPHRDDAYSPLRRCYTGPSPTRERQQEIEQRFGLQIVCGYALSESPYGLVWGRGTRPFGTLGMVRQHPRLGRINEARVNPDGELELRNPAVMLGYWGMPEETEQVLVDGWLRTGDLVQYNADGTYTFLGRKKEIIRRRGENLSPTEVEEALGSHPAVLETAVIGVPSELSEEDVKAFVVLREGFEPASAELREHAAERLTGFKVPRYIEVVEELPHTATGRVAKPQLPREVTGREWDSQAESQAQAPADERNAQAAP